MPYKSEPTGFGDRLSVLRDEQGLTQQQLADEIGINTNTLAKIERGIQEPSWPLVLAFSRALRVSVAYFEMPLERKPKRRKPGRPRKC